MIQRIQSIFLLLSALILGANFKIPFAYSSDASHPLFADGIYNLMEDQVLLGLYTLGILVTLAIILLYKRRALQLKLTIMSFLIIGGIFGILASKFVSFQEYNLALGSFTPAGALICLILAYIFIKKDDKLVKSMDRLR
jgi:hypothetical protein